MKVDDFAKLSLQSFIHNTHSSWLATAVAAYLRRMQTALYRIDCREHILE